MARSRPFSAKPRRSKQRKRRAETFVEPFDATITIDSLGARGDGLAQLDEQRVHVPGSLPGEVVSARIAGERGQITAIETPSADRVEAPCEHYGDCGGCSLQHMAVPALANWKRDQVHLSLAREGIEDVTILPSALLPTNTRRRATFSIAKDSGSADIKIGFRARQTHRTVHLNSCHILTPALFKAAQQLRPLMAYLFDLHRKALARRADLAKNGLTVQLNNADNGLDLNIMSGLDQESLTAFAIEDLANMMRETSTLRLSVRGEAVLTLGSPVIDFNGIDVDLPPGAFLQASAQGQSAILDAIRAGLAQFPVKKGAAIADLFCGCGAFALPLSEQYSVYAADNVKNAVEAMAQAHTRKSGLKSLKTEVRDLYRQPLAPDELNRFDAVIFDPPRAGAPAQVKQMIECTVPLVIGVSCNPASFARDARLLAKGGYILSQVQLVDQFAFSPHIELVGMFIKRD